jgi:GNAT superfamily N-acetyltransferase
VNVTSRTATSDDVDELIRLYRLLEAEQAALRPLWPLADGLDEPIEASFRAVLADPESTLIVGELDAVPLGLLWTRPEPLLTQAEGERVGTIRLIFTQLEARGIGIGEAMMAQAMGAMRAAGLRYMDARVSPGHRFAKNFFEANGFKARLILMHRDDQPADD